MEDDEIIRGFFEGLAGPHPQVPSTVSGRIRFDVGEGRGAEHWLLTFDGGRVTADRSEAEADCVVRSDAATLAAIIAGRMNAMAALLRGAWVVRGDALLLALFRSLLTATEEPVRSGRAGTFTGRRQ